MAAEQRSERQAAELQRQAAELQRQAEVSEQQAAELQSKLQSMQSMRRQISQNEVALQQAKATTHQVTHGEGKEGGGRVVLERLAYRYALKYAHTDTYTLLARAQICR